MESWFETAAAIGFERLEARGIEWTAPSSRPNRISVVAISQVHHCVRIAKGGGCANASCFLAAFSAIMQAHKPADDPGQRVLDRREFRADAETGG